MSRYILKSWLNRGTYCANKKIKTEYNRDRRLKG